MLEPLAASVLSTFFTSARPLVSHRLSALAMVATTVVLPSDFFIPIPGQTKGKERATPNVGYPWSDHSDTCQGCYAGSEDSGEVTISCVLL